MMMDHGGARALHEKQEKEKRVATSETTDGYRLKVHLAERHRDRERFTDLQTGSACVIHRATQSTWTRPQLPALEKLASDRLYINYHSHGYVAPTSRTEWISQEWCAPPIKRQH